MARSYSELIGLVRSWSNRDLEVLPNNIIADSVRYAADKAYRQLRIAPLENTVVYTREMLERATRPGFGRFNVTELAIPADLIEFIEISERDENNAATRVFNEKADIRTFNDPYAAKYNDLAFWTRQGNNILLTPGFGRSGDQSGGSLGLGQGECVQLYYYRRLPALHARYNISVDNAMLGLNTVIDTDNPLPTTLDMTPEEVPQGALFREIVDGVTRFSAEAAPGFTEVQVFGNSVPNWLRDENERIVLMGALAECFFYLQENDEAQKYAALFAAEIAEVNDEDNKRNASGGNVQVHFNGRGLI